MEQIGMVMIRWEWFRHLKRRDETENIRAIAELKIEWKHPRRDKKAWKIRDEPTTDRYQNQNRFIRSYYRPRRPLLRPI